MKEQYHYPSELSMYMQQILDLRLHKYLHDEHEYGEEKLLLRDIMHEYLECIDKNDGILPWRDDVEERLEREKKYHRMYNDVEHLREKTYELSESVAYWKENP